MVYHCEYDPSESNALSAASLLDVPAVFSLADVEMVKSAAKGRHVVRFALPDGRSCYIKRYPKISFLAALRARLMPTGHSSDAMREWLALSRANDIGVSVIMPLVVGEERRWGLVRRAFVITLDGERDSTLEAVALEGDHDLQSTAAHVASILARLHDGGVNHRDFYIGHLLMNASDTTGESIRLMDFNRADVRSSVSERWRVKDLAALHFSMPLRRMNAFGRLRFLLQYTRGDTSLARVLARQIQVKVIRMTAHVQNMLARGESNVHINS